MVRGKGGRWVKQNLTLIQEITVCVPCETQSQCYFNLVLCNLCEIIVQ